MHETSLSRTEISPSIHVYANPSGVRADAADLWIAIDVLRATTTIAFALDAGAEAVVPVETVEAATRLAGELGRDSTVLCGERESVAVEGFDLGNSPLEYLPETVAGKTLVLCTTNGSRVLSALGKSTTCLAASFVTLGACAARAALAPRVSIVCAGSDGRFALEDFLCAGMLTERIVSAGASRDLDDGARASLELYDRHRLDPAGAIRASDHGRSLVDLGFEADLEAACRVDAFDIVPVLRGGRITADAAEPGAPDEPDAPDAPDAPDPEIRSPSLT